MTASVAAHVVERILASKLADAPFPYFYATDIFPAGFYQEALRRFPSDAEFIDRSVTGKPAYEIPLQSPETLRLADAKRAFWDELTGWMLDDSFTQALANHIFVHLKRRFVGRADVALRGTGALNRTKTGYLLGPHTDARDKVFTLVFYLPRDARFADWGTSIWRPRAPGFTCLGGPHHAFAAFEKIATMPFVPNSVFGFVKTDNSFHGVEPWQAPEFVRDTLSYAMIDDAFRP